MSFGKWTVTWPALQLRRRTFPSPPKISLVPLDTSLLISDPWQQVSFLPAPWYFLFEYFYEGDPTVCDSHWRNASDIIQLQQESAICSFSLPVVIVVWTHYDWFTCSPDGGHLCCSPVFDITNNTSNEHVHTNLGVAICSHFFWVNTSEWDCWVMVI